MIYRAEILSKEESKNPAAVYLITKGNIVDAAIEATQKMKAQKSDKKLRVAKVEEIPGEEI